LTLNLNGGAPAATPATPTTNNNPLASPKICNLPSLIPLVPTPVEKNVNKNESVTVTHFSDIHGGIVEKISVPVTSSSVVENGQKSPKSEVTKTSTTISNNPFADEMITTTIISTTTAAITSPSIKVSTNPFRSSFNSGEKVEDKSLKISFPITAKNPFTDESFDNGNEADDVDNSERNLSSISSVKIENNQRNVTAVEDTHPPQQLNGYKEKEAKKVTSIFRVISLHLLFIYILYQHLFLHLSTKLSVFSLFIPFSGVCLTICVVL
jgi:hypothetical protein